MNWILDREQFTKYNSFNEFLDQLLAFGLDNSRGERLAIEQTIQREIGSNYLKIDAAFCACTNCIEKVGPDHIWKQVNLRSLAFNLQQRRHWINWAAANFPDDAEEMMDAIREVFDLGYFTARLFDEYAMKTKIEPDALEGIKHAEHKTRRAKAAGMVSRSNRERRIDRCWNTWKRSLPEALMSFNSAPLRWPTLRSRTPSRPTANYGAKDKVSETSTLMRFGRIFDTNTVSRHFSDESAITAFSFPFGAAMVAHFQPNALR